MKYSDPVTHRIVQVMVSIINVIHVILVCFNGENILVMTDDPLVYILIVNNRDNKGK